ncbi:hypothetical protein AVEN_151001-1 [Araneus ventricosus]|uniref:Uncharacterized protein n=1 Tax=Araneus ventricosus TaxID=182803 RepID=A0A4Y2J3N5_ARAVE|nr:hypothetical protein AVEN_241139-1 [Araneus ventricosus]GBM84650.1 hypothetical protein AVEN_139209-1 [Araneus ventricosus]GBM85052.1 hypothetical protein AVEN_151001-1 [Araneus ventricosus]
MKLLLSFFGGKVLRASISLLVFMMVVGIMEPTPSSVSSLYHQVPPIFPVFSKQTGSKPLSSSKDTNEDNPKNLAPMTASFFFSDAILSAKIIDT